MIDSSKTRISLILRLRRPADAEAWEEFCELYQPLIFRIARSRELQIADANDLTQEVFVRVARSVENWNPDPDLGSFRSWIGKIARNLLIDFLRSQQRQPLTGENSNVSDALDGLSGRSVEADFVDAEFEKQRFAWAANKIKPSFQVKTWQAFWQTAVEQRSIEEVAGELGMSTGALYVARSRVIARLRKAVESHDQDHCDETSTPKPDQRGEK